MPPKGRNNKSSTDVSDAANSETKVVNDINTTDDICGIVDKAIKAAMVVFKTELIKLFNEKFDQIVTRLNKLEQDHVAMRAVVTKLESEKAAQTSFQSESVAAIHGASSNTGTSRAALAAVHVELADKQRRSRNVIVSGLAPVSGKSNAELFSELCEDNLPIKPSFISDSCRRLGKPQVNKIQPLLVTLSSSIAAADVLACAGELRKSTNATIKSSVYINADLTPAEALAAYEGRVRRRERRQQSAQNSANEGEAGGAHGGQQPGGVNEDQQSGEACGGQQPGVDCVQGSSFTTGAVTSKPCV
jgi:hypothetical protein